MLLSTLKVLFQHKRQVIPDLNKVELPASFRGRPILDRKNIDTEKLEQCIELCPTGAITATPFTLDMGKCLFCGECERVLPENIKFTNSWKLWSLTREGLIITAENSPKEVQSEIAFGPNTIKVKHPFRRSLRLRQVCAGGDSAPEMELGAACNVNFDMGRFGIEFVASPRHSDGVVLTGPITKKMASPLEMTYAAVPDPKLLIAVGVDAISGGMFADSPQIDRSFLERYPVDLYVAGHPSHPLAIIGGLRELMKSPVRRVAPQQQVKQ